MLLCLHPPLLLPIPSMDPPTYQSTPYKKRTSHATHSSQRVTNADELELIVRTEMHHSAFGNTPDFFDTLFACDDTLIDQIYESFISGDKPLYSEDDGCWTSLPTNPTSEHALYEPLVNILNAITEANGKAMAFILVWQDNHSKSVKSDAAADLKPDIIGLIQACKADSPDLWRLLQTIIEVKNPISLLPGLLQVLKYSRQALYEQVDRRFIFGLVFGKTDLTVWHVDRSGTLGSEPFDVHKVCNRSIILTISKYIYSAFLSCCLSPESETPHTCHCLHHHKESPGAWMGHTLQNGGR